MELMIKDGQEVKTIDSREVAEMMEKRHADLMRDIRVYKEHMEDNADLHSQNFFIESTYKNSQNKEQPCYLLTKKGCEFVANKMTGAKGTIFTAKYIERFNKMEEHIKAQILKPVTQLDILEMQMNVLKEHDKKIKDVEDKVQQLEEDMPLFNIDCKNIQAVVKRKGVEILGGYASPAYKNRSLRGRVYADIQGQIKREFGVSRYEAIKRSQIEKVKELVEKHEVPGVLAVDIIIESHHALEGMVSGKKSNE